MHVGTLNLRRASVTSKPELVRLGYSFLQRCQLRGETASHDKVIPISADWVGAWETYLSNHGAVDARDPAQHERTLSQPVEWTTAGTGADAQTFVAPYSEEKVRSSLFFCLEDATIHARKRVDKIQVEELHFS